MPIIIFLYIFRMYETKMKEFESDIAKKNQSIIDLKQLVREATEREQKAKKYTEDLEQQACNHLSMINNVIYVKTIPELPEGENKELLNNVCPRRLLQWVVLNPSTHASSDKISTAFILLLSTFS